MPGLLATGTLSYNGYTFDGATRIEVQTEFLMEDARRSVKVQKITLTVRAVIANDSTSGDLDADILNIRKRLGESGRQLRFTGKGFGDDLNVNVGTVKDVEHGPDPIILSWTPLGDDKAAEIVWQVSVVIPVTLDNPRYRGIMSINWGLSYLINQHGSTTRTLAGHIEIAMNKVGQDTADAYRQHFEPQPLDGFSRQQTWTITPDQKRCAFQIVDTQIPSPNAYPPRITAIDGTHRISWNRGNAATVQNSMTATITPEAGLTGTQAWAVFLTLFSQRTSYQRSRRRAVFLNSVDVEEDIFGRPQSFRVGWWNLVPVSELFGNLAADAGLWRPIGTKWNLWAKSLGESTFHQRGSAGLGDLAANDAVIDLGTTQGTIVPNNLQRRGSVRPIFAGQLVNSKPEADTSWISASYNLMLYRNRPVSRQSVIQDEDDTTPGSFKINEEAAPSRSLDFPDETGFIDDIIQQGGRSRYGVRLITDATRAGHEIPRAALVDFGGLKPIERWTRIITKTVGDFFGVPVFRTASVTDYLLTKAPGRVQPLNDCSGAGPETAKRTRKVTTRTPGRPANSFQMF